MAQVINDLIMFVFSAVFVALGVYVIATAKRPPVVEGWYGFYMMGGILSIGIGILIPILVLS